MLIRECSMGRGLSRVGSAVARNAGLWRGDCCCGAGGRRCRSFGSPSFEAGALYVVLWPSVPFSSHRTESWKCDFDGLICHHSIPPSPTPFYIFIPHHLFNLPTYLFLLPRHLTVISRLGSLLFVSRLCLHPCLSFLSFVKLVRGVPSTSTSTSTSARLARKEEV